MRVFGPVPSRRFGNSLGIDLCPFKTCTLNCVYCELGRTKNLTVRRKEFFSPEIIIKDFKKVNLKNIDVITFTASGEPTLYKGIDKILSYVKKKTNLPTLLLTNGSLLYRSDVIKEIKNFDIVAPNLDAVSENVFRKINRPHPSLNIKKIIEGLKNFRKKFKGNVFLEIVFVKGFNDKDGEIKKFKKAIEYIEPEEVHLNTVYRPGAEKYAIPVEISFLEEVKNFLGKNVKIFGEYKKKKKVIMTEKMIEELIKHRPITIPELKLLLKFDEKFIEKEVSRLVKEGKVFKKGKFFIWR